MRVFKRRVVDQRNFHGAKLFFCGRDRRGTSCGRDAHNDTRDACATQKRVWTSISPEIDVQARWPARACFGCYGSLKRIARQGKSWGPIELPSSSQTEA